MKKLLILALVSIPMLAQETINYSGAAKVIPFPVVNANPGACSPGQVITRIDLDNVYICDHTGTWIGLGTGSGITSFSVASVPSWLTASVATATTTPALTLGAATGRASHLVIGTCGSATSFAPCALVVDDLPTIASSNLNDQANTPSQTPGDAVVDLSGTSFTDESSATSTTTISVGQTVSWKWVSGSHVVVSLSAHCSADPCAPLEDQRFDSGDPTSTVGHRFAYTFTSPGTYYYYCDVHGAVMQGTVVVLEAAPLHTPASSSESCTTGQWADDASFHYVCTSSNVWKRVALSSF